MKITRLAIIKSHPLKKKFTKKPLKDVGVEIFYQRLCLKKSLWRYNKWALEKYIFIKKSTNPKNKNRNGKFPSTSSSYGCWMCVGWDQNSHMLFPRLGLLLDLFGHVMHFWTSTWVDLIDAYNNPKPTFSSNITYWHTLDSVCPKQWPSNGFALSRFTQDTTAFKAWAQVAKFELSSLT